MANKPLLPIEAAVQERSIAVRILRMTFLVLVTTVVLLYTIERRQGIASGQSNLEAVAGWWMPVAFGGVATFVVLLIDLRTPSKKISTISGLVLGVVAGLVATYALSFVIDLVASTYDLTVPVVDAAGKPTGTRVNLPVVTAVKVIIGICMVYLAISTVLQTQDDFRLAIPYVEFAKQIRGPKPLVLDTSALVDARIADMAGTGFLQTPVVVPSFVVMELQRLADSDDKLKRAKGRRGLDVVTRLQRTPGLDVTIDETPVPGMSVDQMLVELARTMPAIVVTADSALSRMAAIQDVRILNLNDLANSLKPALIPGSSLTIAIAKRGEQPGQGVGYLDDGTMLVVENAGELVGSEVSVEVTSSLQTSAGRLMFARLNAVREMAVGQTGPAIAGGSNSDTGDPEHEDGSDAADVDADAPPAQPGITPPVTIRPPNPPPEKPGPFPPKRGRGNPLRNPRR
ncbi:MAG: PIN/TRAM domain-containing protein [Phycisphaerales bacterium]